MVRRNGPRPRKDAEDEREDDDENPFVRNA